MIEKLNALLSGIPMTILSGLLLLCSLLLPKAGISLPLDPAWGAVLISGLPLVYLAVWRIWHNPGISKISSALLISIAMAAAILIGDLFAAGEVAFIMAIGEKLEDKTTQRARKGLLGLISLAPEQGRRITGEREEMIPARDIQAGDVLRVLPGESFPVDGVVLAGVTTADQSIMTGESLPVDKAPGDAVFCGTINRFGSVDIRATKVGQDSSLQKLIRMVEEAENNQAPMQRMADKAASYLVPVALLTAIIGYLATQDIVRAVTILVVFCPCALVLATPTAIMAAIGQATKQGVIIKSGEALEKMGRVDTLAFDKTGTLTFGRLQVSDVLCFSQAVSREELLCLAAAAESRSEHPLGKAIAACARAENLPLDEAESFSMQAGRGVMARVAGKTVLCGSESFLLQQNIPLPEAVTAALAPLRAQGKALVLTAVDGECVGVLALSDALRPTAGPMVKELEKLGTRAVLLTGDTHQAAAYFAQQVGMAEVHAQLLPEEKVAAIRQLQNEGHILCMVGDGVNDAPALKTAQVGIAMGSMGSDIAIEAADIALMSDDISKLPYLKRLSNATRRTIKFSIALSLCINAVAIVLSLMGVLTPTLGALWHNCGSCLVVLIAALLYDRNFL